MLPEPTENRGLSVRLLEIISENCSSFHRSVAEWQRRLLDALNEQFALKKEFPGQVVVKREEKLLVSFKLAVPGVAIDPLEFFELLLRKAQAVPVEILVARLPANRRIFGQSAPVHAIDNPAEHGHILAEARRKELALRVFAKPVHVKN